MDNPEAVHAVQALGYPRQLLARGVRELCGGEWVGVEIRTSSSLPTFGSFLRYCLRSRPSMYS